MNNTFAYKSFFVIYKQYLKDCYAFALVTKEKKVLIQDSVMVQDFNLVETEIVKKLNSLLSKQKVGIFRIEIMFAEKTYQPYVSIWLPSDELICDELKTTEKNVPKILLNMKKMLTTEIVMYRGFSIIDFKKYGDNLQQRNIVAFTINRRGQYECLFDDNINELKARIDKVA